MTLTIQHNIENNTFTVWYGNRQFDWFEVDNEDSIEEIYSTIYNQIQEENKEENKEVHRLIEEELNTYRDTE